VALPGGRVLSTFDIDPPAIEAHRLDHLVEQLSGAPDKRDARSVFVCAGGLAHEHEAGVGVAVAENDLCVCRDEVLMWRVGLIALAEGIESLGLVGTPALNGFRLA